MEAEPSIPPHGVAGACPSCDRFIGPAAACPYCGAENRFSRGLWVLRLAALPLAMGGLLFLYLVCVCRDVPRVRAAEMTPRMNFVCAEVSGSIQRPPRVVRKQGRVDAVSFPIRDETGEIWVAAYGRVAAALVDAGAVPAEGSCVKAVGSLRVDAGRRVTLYLQTPEQLSLLLRPGETP